MHFFLLFCLLSIGVSANSSLSHTEKFAPKYEKVITDLGYLQIFAIASIGIIALLPEDISRWTKDDKRLVSIQELLKKHHDNVNAGPMIDNDSLAINYIGHPIAGSYFYVWGRQSGLSWQESFILTSLMSTFYWEYGWEAFAETPSTQDLIITPILGALLGEYTNHLYNQILYNHGEIYQSKVLGNIARGLLNPIGETNDYLKDVFDTANIEISVDYAYAKDKPYANLQNFPQDRGLIQSYFRLNFKFKY